MSEDDSDSRIVFADSSLSNTTDTQQGTCERPALSDLSERDKVWDQRRHESDMVERHYQGTEFQRYADRIHFCADFLAFKLADKGSGELGLKLSGARFCHCRHCVVCQWRKSLRIKARAYKSLPRIISDYPTSRFLFLTLTVKNCSIENLRETILHMNKSWQRLSQLKAFPAIGYLRTTEVTRGRDGRSAHPHFHCLLQTQASYFGKKYIKQSQWVEMWQKSLRSDYKPILDVQALKAESSLVSLLAEIIKYEAKPSSLCYAEPNWFLEMTRQMHGLKCLSLGGTFKRYFAELEREPTNEEMIHTESEEEKDLAEDDFRLYFSWQRRRRKYQMI
jgi:plasmid rolling circle replication initiator protein Rep